MALASSASRRPRSAAHATWAARAKLIAEHLGREGVTPALVLCSSARRTRETFERIAPVLGEGITVQIERELYAASEQRPLERLRAVDDGKSSRYDGSKWPGCGSMRA